MGRMSEKLDTSAISGKELKNEGQFTVSLMFCDFMVL